MSKPSQPASGAPAALAYPPARRSDHVDVYHGTPVPDPYRWLEDTESAESRAWLQASAAQSEAYLAGLKLRPELERRLTQLWAYERHGLPIERGGRYFTSRNDGLQSHSVSYWSESLEGEPRVLLDPNTWSSDGSIALSGLSVSPDGRRVAYAVQTAGSDWLEWRVREVERGSDGPDRIAWTKFTTAAWTADGQGFFYTRLPEPEPGAAFTATNAQQKVYYHRLGEPQSADRLIFERPEEPHWLFDAQVSDDGRFLFIRAQRDTGHANRLWFAELEQGVGAPLRELVSEFEFQFTPIDNDGPLLWLRTDWGAPHGRVIAVDTRQPGREHWRELIPECADTLRGAAVVGEQFFVQYLRDVHTRVVRYSLQGAPLGEVELPGIGTASGFDGRRGQRETFYHFTSYSRPAAVYRCDAASGASALWRAPRLDFDGSPYETRQVFYTSADGTRVPMFIAHRRGLRLDGSHPTLLYGYGGFAISLLPEFSPSVAVWLERGGVYAVANLRGGGEYGEAWHRAGTQLRKQNVFDDFFAAAEYLIDQGYTRPARLAISGRSNGGLLVGAALTQRPELFGVALPAVGVLDMLRFHKFTIGWAWVDDYGSSDDPEQFKALLAYSPLHNARPGREYPATLISTADHDDRVVPCHSYKFAAALQHAAQGSARPVLLRIQRRGGHGQGTPTAALIAQGADWLAFALHALGEAG